MNFLKFDLGQQNAGATAVVSLSGVESDVFLVDPMNLGSFERGQRFNYFGGHYKVRQVRLSVPTSGHWYVVVAPSGGPVSASVEVIGAP